MKIINLLQAIHKHCTKGTLCRMYALIMEEIICAPYNISGNTKTKYVRPLIVMINTIQYIYKF